LYVCIHVPYTNYLRYRRVTKDVMWKLYIDMMANGLTIL
jgi:hypothetical protein